MQLKKPKSIKPVKSIKKSLALATSALLAGISQPGHAEDSNKPWEIDSAILIYAESDRVAVFEPVVELSKDLGDDELLKFRVVVDTLTGSSPNGAIALNTPQTFTRASGNGSYTVGANETPLDPNFRDNRVALSAEWTKPLGKTLKGIFGTYASKEVDYTSFGFSGTLSKDFNKRNTTLTAGLAISLDNIDPIGGVPVGLTDMPALPAKKTITGSDESKTVADVLLGVTQVISRKTLMQFNFSYGLDDGYMTDPYKILTVLDGGGNLSVATPYIYENRPDSRSRQALYWKTIHQFKTDVIRTSYRYYWDDWGIKSHTVDLKYHMPLGKKHYLQPHLRYYLQSKADFYYYNLVEGSIPQYASADYRLGDMSTTTLGVKYGYKFKKKNEFAMRLEAMKQSPEGDAPFPEVDAIILQFSYSMYF